MKSKSIKWLTLHVLIYLAMLLIASFVIFDPKLILDFVIVNGVLHWVTDLITSRLNAHLFQLKNKHWFYIGVGADQFIHAACLIFTFEYYTSLNTLPYLFQLILG